ncbi:hypothetical protein FJZ19_00950 [Candidatus Pacearchaeota archaeon]|nr:hypothetical protein [Candidatus Pacearchaeota archaeon]
MKVIFYESPFYHVRSKYEEAREALIKLGVEDIRVARMTEEVDRVLSLDKINFVLVHFDGKAIALQELIRNHPEVRFFAYSAFTEEKGIQGSIGELIETSIMETGVEGIIRNFEQDLSRVVHNLRGEERR